MNYDLLLVRAEVNFACGRHHADYGHVQERVQDMQMDRFLCVFSDLPFL